MCGRYRLSRRKQIIEEHFDSTSGEEDWIPRYNIAPTQPVPIIRQHPKERVKEFSLISLRAVQDSLIVDDVQVFRAQREHLPLSRLAEELCKFDKSFSGS